MNDEYCTVQLDCWCVDKYMACQKFIMEMAFVIRSAKNEHHDICVVPCRVVVMDATAHLSCAGKQSDCRWDVRIVAAFLFTPWV